MESKGNNILVKQIPKERVLASGIIIPDTIKIKGQNYGTVLESNPYIFDNDGNGIEVGSRVLFLGESKEGEQIINNRQVLYWNEQD